MKGSNVNLWKRTQFAQDRMIDVCFNEQHAEAISRRLQLQAQGVAVIKNQEQPPLR